MRVSLVNAAVLLIGAATTLAACNTYGDGPAGRHCMTEVGSDASSPAPGALTLQGKFFANESVILQYTVNGQERSASGTPATDRTSFTLTGLPSGPLKYDILVSCSEGQDELGPDVYSVQ